MELSDWLQRRFGCPAPHDTAAVACFLTPVTDVAPHVECLLPHERAWLMLYVVLDEERYARAELSRAERIFVSLCRAETRRVANVMCFDLPTLRELWVASGITI